MWANDTNYTAVKNGVVVVSGTGPAIRVDGNRLVIRDGPKDTRPLALTRAEASRRLRHIIMVGNAGGFLTVAALHWLRDTNTALSMLDFNGRVVFANGPRGPDRPSLRRAQALVCSGIAPEAGVAIAREILRAKLSGEAQVARRMGREDTSAAIGELVAELERETAGPKVLAIEARSARLYWEGFENLPVRFARDNPERLDAKARWRPGRSEAWLRFGNRASTLTGKPLRATSPGNAVLNFLFAIARTEMAVALHAVGLDEGIGLFHADIDGRPSLALDAIEAVRPLVEGWLLEFLAVAAFANRDFHETADGEVRLAHPLNSHLAHTAALWQPACQNVAQWLASAFGDTIGTARPRRPKKPDRRPEQADALVEAANVPMLAGPWAATLPPGFPRPLLIPPGGARAFSARRDHLLRGALQDAPVPLTCWQCGRELPQGRRRFCTDEHAVDYHRDSEWGSLVAATIARYADPKRAAASKTAIAKRAAENAAQRRLWRQRPGWSKAGDEALRQWFASTAQARLGDCKIAAIMAATGLSRQLAEDIRSGRHIPHPRHVEALARLAGVEAPATIAVLRGDVTRRPGSADSRVDVTTIQGQSRTVPA